MYREVFKIFATHIRRFIYSAIILFLLLNLPVSKASEPSSPSWSAKLDSKVHFYQTTELGVLVVGTEKSLYAIDGERGDVLWHRKNARLDETDVAPIIGTDLLLLSFEKGGKTRVEAVDLLTGNALWQSDKIKGGVMQMAVDLESDLAAVVLVRNAKGRAREGFKKRPTVHLMNLTNGEEVWKYELESEVEMTPAQWSEDEDKETVYTLDNYRAPLFLDGRLYLFYEGVTSLDARTGKERIRERFRVNEEGLALTEADPVIDEQNIYTSGRGRVRAISRATGREGWEAKDLGLTPEMMLVIGILYVRTGGLFTRLKDGEIAERGPYGVSAIDAASGKILWRYRGADRGITNLALLDPSTLLVADRDELLTLDIATGKPRSRMKHRIDRAAFVLINEPRQAVVGGRSSIAAFDIARGGEEVWRARYDPPGRGVLRTVAAIAARSAALYFRYGGVATTAFRGVQIVQGVSSLRWSGLASRVVLPNLTDFAAGAAREYVTSQIKPYGIVSRVDLASRAARAVRSRQITPSISVNIDVEERLMDRLDPARQLERLSRFLWRRKQLAVLRGQFIYFYTDLKDAGGRGLAGVNLHTGLTERRIRLNEVDHRLTTDEVINQLYLAQDDRLFAHPLDRRE
ncbi:MAG: PQQ-binding-like beta-propeller repeat protein [Acidobacteria bacterium]|nr:PQQ-binding-like beta-propeller repeat protein [Acidobacteriota bacterium]